MWRLRENRWSMWVLWRFVIIRYWRVLLLLMVVTVVRFQWFRYYIFEEVVVDDWFGYPNLTPFTSGDYSFCYTTFEIIKCDDWWLIDLPRLRIVNREQESLRIVHYPFLSDDPCLSLSWDVTLFSGHFKDDEALSVIPLYMIQHNTIENH